MEMAVGHLDSVQTDEEMTYDNMPENLQDSLRGMDSQDSIDALDDAASLVREAIDRLRDIPGI